MDLAPAFSANARTHVCSFCGCGPGKTNPLDPQSHDRPVVTTDVDVEWEGIFEFCLSCAAEAGSLAGMIPEAVAQELRTEQAHNLSSILSLTAERDAARKALDALTAELANRPAKKSPAKKAASAAA